jgi:hypothetical protein
MRCGASHDFSAREAAANEPAGAPFLPALKCDFRQSFDRQNAPGHRAYLKMKPLSLHEPLLGCIEVSGKQGDLTQQKRGQALAGTRVGILGHSQQFLRGLRDLTVPGRAAKAELGETEMPIEYMLDESRFGTNPIDEFGSKQLRPLRFHVRGQPQQSASLTDFPCQPSPKRHIPGLPRNLAGLVELTALQMHQTPGERRTDAIRRGCRIRTR